MLPAMIDIGVIVKLTLKLGLLLVVAAWLFDLVVSRFAPRSPLHLRFRDVPGLKPFVLLQLALTGFCYLSLLWWKRITLGTHVPLREYPYTTPFIPFMRFHDLLAYSDRMVALHTPRFFSPEFAVTWQYPPAMSLLYVPLALHRTPRQTIVLFLAIVVAVLLPMAFLFARRLMREGLSGLQAYGLAIGSILLSYPLWTEMLLGNMEIFGTFLVAAGLLCFFRDRLYAAAVLFGLAAAIKIFPFVYFALFLHRRKFKPMLAGAVAIVAANLAGLWLLCPSLAYGWRQVQDGLAQNREHYMLTLLWQETAIDHSGFGIVKRLFVRHYGNHMPPFLLSRYMLLVAAIGLLSYFLRIRKLPELNQVVALSVASILLPPTSHDYTLLNLYVPWAMLVVFAVRSVSVPEQVRGVMPAMLCFAALFSSESELIHHRSNYSGQLKCLVLAALFAIVLRFPWARLQPGSGDAGSLGDENLAVRT